MTTRNDLIKKIDENYPKVGYAVVQAIIRDVDRDGWLRNPGEPIDPEDIRKGDRVRIEYTEGSVLERMAGGPISSFGEKYFLLDRPKPELPTEPGSVVKTRETSSVFILDKKGRWWCDGYSVNPGWLDNVEWEVLT